MSVDVIRLGEEDNFCSVCYETVDVSALAGVTRSSKSVRKCWLKEWQQSRHHCAYLSMFVCWGCDRAATAFVLVLGDTAQLPHGPILKRLIASAAGSKIHENSR